MNTLENKSFRKPYTGFITVGKGSDTIIVNIEEIKYCCKKNDNGLNKIVLKNGDREIYTFDKIEKIYDKITEEISKKYE